MEQKCHLLVCPGSRVGRMADLSYSRFQRTAVCSGVQILIWRTQSNHGELSPSSVTEENVPSPELGWLTESGLDFCRLWSAGIYHRFLFSASRRILNAPILDQSYKNQSDARKESGNQLPQSKWNGKVELRLAEKRLPCGKCR